MTKFVVHNPSENGVDIFCEYKDGFNISLLKGNSQEYHETLYKWLLWNYGFLTGETIEIKDIVPPPSSEIISPPLPETPIIISPAEVATPVETVSSISSQSPAEIDSVITPPLSTTSFVAGSIRRSSKRGRPKRSK